MILDWDVHHGNGTNDIFQEDKDVLFVSIHRHDNGHFYPGEGAAEDIGTGDGEGYCINVPLDKGYGDVDMEYVMKKFGLEDQLESISKIHGRKFNIPNSDMVIIPLYHPAVAVYNRNMLKDLKEDFETLI